MNQEEEDTVIGIIRKQLRRANENDWTLEEFAQRLETEVLQLEIIEGFGVYE